MSMGFMVAAASRKRDDRGRYMDGDRQMEGNYSRMDDQPEMRRRRDSRGRYMEGEPSAHYMPWPERHIPPYLDHPDMREERNVRPGRERREDPRMEVPVHMRDRNIVNIRDYQDRRRIGFGENRMEDEAEDDEMRHYGRRFNPDRMNMGHTSHQSHQMGRADYQGDDEHLSREDAEKWVRGMKSEDGKTGGRWPLQEIKQYAGNFGIQGEEKVIEFFAVMNALYTDYCKVAKKHGVDKVDFWADMAKAFMADKDANPGKVKMYYECIAKKDDD